MIALVVGQVVWAVIAGACVAWLAVTLAAGPRSLPGLLDVGRWILGSWAGRLLALGCWSYAGWHLFCQRP